MGTTHGLNRPGRRHGAASKNPPRVGSHLHEPIYCQARRLRTAILSPDARERLVKDAMRAIGGDRAAAVRKVLQDLYDEDKRWS